MGSWEHLLENAAIPDKGKCVTSGFADSRQSGARHPFQSVFGTVAPAARRNSAGPFCKTCTPFFFVGIRSLGVALHAPTGMQLDGAKWKSQSRWNSRFRGSQAAAFASALTCAYKGGRASASRGALFLLTLASASPCVSVGTWGISVTSWRVRGWRTTWRTHVSTRQGENLPLPNGCSCALSSFSPPSSAQSGARWQLRGTLVATKRDRCVSGKIGVAIEVMRLGVTLRPLGG